MSSAAGAMMASGSADKAQKAQRQGKKGSLPQSLQTRLVNIHQRPPPPQTQLSTPLPPNVLFKGSIFPIKYYK